MTVDLGLHSSAEGTGHAAKSELGRECKGRELGLSGILEGKGLETDEVFVAIGANGSVRGESNCRNLRDVDTGVDGLQKGLLLSISSVDGDFSRAELRESWGGAAILPRNNSGLTSGIGGSGDRSSDENGGESRRRKSKGNKDLGEHLEGYVKGKWAKRVWVLLKSKKVVCGEGDGR